MGPFCYKIVLSVCLCHTVVSVPRSFVVTCCEMADLLALFCLLFSCVFVTFPYGTLGQVWYLIVSIPDLCLLPCFVYNTQATSECSDQTARMRRLI